MLSRVADSLYWMNRYIERAENIARIIDANFQMILDLPVGAEEQWQPLVTITGDHDLFAEKDMEFSRDNVIHFLAFDQTNPNSIVSCLNAARENARSIREHISSEMWQVVNTFFLKTRDAALSGKDFNLSHEFLFDVMTSSQHFVGVTSGTMSHGEGWHFGRLGRMLERADQTSRILDVKYFILLPSVAYVGTPYDNILWAALLRSISAFEMYRKRFGGISPEKIVDFLVLDRELPRAIHFCLIVAAESLWTISGTPRYTFRNLADKRLGRLLADLDFLQVEEILEGGLHEFLDGLQGRLNLIGDAVQETFFSVPEASSHAHSKEPSE